MKKVLKIALTVICWLVCIHLSYETINGFNSSEFFGLSTLIKGTFSVIFLVGAVILTKSVIENNDINGKNPKQKMILIVAIAVVVMSSLNAYIRYLKLPSPSEIISYGIVYERTSENGLKSDISIFSDRVEITTTKDCNNSNCKTKKEVFSYSKDNIKKLTTFMDDNFSKEYISVNDYNLTERQKEVIQGMLLGEYFFEIAVEEYKYKLRYSKNDSLSYYVYFKFDNSILVKKTGINSDYDIVKVDTYILNFSKENLDVLNNYIEKEIKNENSNIIYKTATLKKNEINIFNSIVENDESYLKNIEDEAKLAYTISYKGINCLTPTLYLYSDNTYEYYYTFGNGNEKLIPKTGTYNYDIKKIINNIDKYEENIFGSYNIKEENGKKYTTYNTNTELQELLTSLDITLEKCLEQQ